MYWVTGVIGKRMKAKSESLNGSKPFSRENAILLVTIFQIRNNKAVKAVIDTDIRNKYLVKNELMPERINNEAVKEYKAMMPEKTRAFIQNPERFLCVILFSIK